MLKVTLYSPGQGTDPLTVCTYSRCLIKHGLSRRKNDSDVSATPATPATPAA